jgi:hypothetical protein
MIQELARPTTMVHRGPDELIEDRAGLFRGLLVAAAVSVPLWAGLIWTLTKIG